MPGETASEWIVVTEDAKTLPAVEILTGRGFVTGKSGSGKSNTASVIVEELLENSYNMLIVDPEGEYYGLKEQYELLHVGADDFCDVEVGPGHAEKLAEIALERNMPVILDVSGYYDGDEAKELIRETVKHIFKREKKARKPFLLVVEEMQEYLPQQGGSDDLADLLERVAKRGRKRGLGVLGLSQRPASVDKDFITQCDWMVWHKLTWENDVNVARNILGADRAAEIETFDTGEAFLMTDWSDRVERVTFKRKRTHDAGATPGLESYERPDLHSVGTELIADLAGEQDIPGQGGDVDGDVNGEVDNAGAGTGNGGEDSGGRGGVAPGDGGDEGRSPGGVDLDPDSIVAEVDVLDDVYGGEADVLEDEDATVDELRAALERMHRRNQLLEDEVEELEQILDEADPAGTPGPFAGNGHDAHEGGRAGGSAGSGGDGPARGAGTARGKPPRPRREPAVPQPPPDRSGVAGNLIEFGQLILYLARRVRFRLAHLGRSDRRDRRRPD